MKRFILLFGLLFFNFSFAQCEISFMDLLTAAKFTNEDGFLKSVAKQNDFNYDSIHEKYICKYFENIKLSKVNSDNKTYIKYEFENKGQLYHNLDLFKSYGEFYKTENNSENSKTDIYIVLKNYAVFVNTKTNNDTNSKDFLKEKYTILISYME